MRTLPGSTSLLDLLEERAFTVARLAAHPLTPTLAKDYDAVRADLLKALETQVSLTEERAKARAVVLDVDAQLDRRLGGIVDTLLELVQDDRSHPLYKRFLGSETPSRMARSVLGRQLDRMEEWLEPLGASPHAGLKAHQPELEKIVKAGRQAELAAQNARGAVETFNNIGERTQLTDKLNVLRESTYHKLVDLRNQSPAAQLPADWPESFFLRDTGRSAEPTLASVEQNLARLSEEVQKQQGLREELRAVAATAAKRRSDEATARVREEAGALRKEMAEKAARLAELEKKLPPTT